MKLYDVQAERIWYLKLKVRNLEAKVSSFESGEKYQRMKDEFKRTLAQANRDVTRLHKEVADAHAETVTVRNLWMDMYDTAEKDYLAQIDALKKENRDLKEKLKQRTEDYYAVGAQLEEEQAKNQKLNAQLHKDYENSSKPSSQKPSHKKIENSREKTGKKRGGQPGHEHHPRARHTPTKQIEIPAEEEMLDTGKYRPTGKMITRQLVKLRVYVDVEEYITPEFIEISTGKKKHAQFPEGVENDVNYDGTVKAFLFLLNTECNVSIHKASDFLKKLTMDELSISAGMINGLNSEFARKTDAERNESFKKLLAAPAMHADFTNARMNGECRQVLVCSSGDTVMYFAREHKGHQGIKDSPVELYDGILITDHDKTFYSYGSEHQECLAHVLRYLKGAAENEPSLTWHTKMRLLIQDMIHYRNSLGEDIPLDAEKVNEFEKLYDEYIAKGKSEYEDEPPGTYYRDGINLLRKLEEYKKEHFLFLRNKEVEATNNEAERYARNYKRKQQQVISFRSEEGIADCCKNLGTLATYRNQEGNLYQTISNIFNR